MTEKQFKELLISMIKISRNPNKSKIIELLNSATIHFDKTTDFTKRKWDHFWEEINISIRPEKLIELKQYQTYLFGVCDEIYPTDDNYMYELRRVNIKPGNLCEEYEDVSQEILFEDIQNKIIEEIRNAKYIIWIAMAWFTNPVIFGELVKMKQRGIDVKIIIDENRRNREAPFHLEDEFETYWVIVQSKFQNIMHNKFCIIDLKTVIHGTFNWTNAANYNKETISIDHNRESAEIFADEFMKLKASATELSLF